MDFNGKNIAAIVGTLILIYLVINGNNTGQVINSLSSAFTGSVKTLQGR